MDLKEIQDLIKFVAKTGVAEVELETKGIKLVIKTGTKNQENYVPVTAIQPTVLPQQTIAPQVVSQPVQETKTTAATPENTAGGTDESKYITINSPMIGTFYRRPSPDKDTFVKPGDKIKPGTVICVIEAMKLFNEIEAEISGTIVKVLVDDTSPVEYDQPLFLVDPS